MLNFLFGQPLRATGYISNAVHHYAVEDNATVMVDYAGGVRGIVDVRWHSKVKRDECRIRGTDGEMELTPLNGPELIYPGGRENLPPNANLHYPMIENFVDAVLGKSPLLASGASSYWTDWVIEQVRQKEFLSGRFKPACWLVSDCGTLIPMERPASVTVIAALFFLVAAYLIIIGSG